MRELILELALGIRQQILPMLGAHSGRRHVAAGGGGDITFQIDEVAESFLESFIAERAMNLAFYSEDRGLVKPSGRAEHVLVVDPIDGTRPALAGLEAACVSVAAATINRAEDDRPTNVTMGDVERGCIVELKTGAIFLAERGAGVQIRNHDLGVSKPNLNRESELARLFWTLGFRGRPARILVEVLGDLIDASSVGGGVFDLGSATYDMTRLLTGQLDAYLDIGTRIIEDIPVLRAEFERVGGGAVLNNSPYDLAAAVLCLQEGGAVVTDAYGRPLDRKPLLGAGHEFQMSCVAASNHDLHAQLLETINRGIDALRAKSL